MHCHLPLVSFRLRRRQGHCSKGIWVTRVADTKSPPIRIVIAEDQAVVRRGQRYCCPWSTIWNVWPSVQWRRGGEVDPASRPDVVLMDLHMPIKGGVAATREITLAQPNTQCWF